jgi:hypothetical protein
MIIGLRGQLCISTLDPQRIILRSFQVRIEPPSTVSVPWEPACRGRFDVEAEGVLEPGGTMAAIVEVFKDCHGRLLRSLFTTGVMKKALPPDLTTQIIFRVKVRAVGIHGGTEIMSDVYEYPIRVCYGCLQTGYRDANGVPDPFFSEFEFQRNKVARCNQLNANPYPGNPCNPAQDFGPLLCCTNSDDPSNIECPGVPRLAAGK